MTTQPTHPPTHPDLRRDYVVSIDWLSLSCDTTLFFNPDAEDGEYVLTDVGHGAKFWRKIANVTRRRDGRKIGQLCWQNTMSNNATLAVIKFENELLYRADCMDVVFDAVLKLGLRFRSISRIDLAIDFNTFKQGLTAPNLIRGYQSNKYFKGGTNKYMINGEHRYFATGADRAQLFTERPIIDKQKRDQHIAELAVRNAELEAHGMSRIPEYAPAPIWQTDGQPLILGEHIVSGITWGNRSSGVQVQLYNKTREMRDVAPKWHIVEAWKAAGLDVSRDVWRLEFRISCRGKELINEVTGQPFRLSLVDVLVQEQVEQLAFAYLEKYFRWYRNDGHEKLANCKRVELFKQDFRPIVKPKQTSRSPKSYNRTAKMISRQLDIHAREMETAGEPAIARLLDIVRDYYKQMYVLGDWLKQQDVQGRLEDGSIRTLEPKFIPIDARYYSADGLRALAIGRHTSLALDTSAQAVLDEIDHDEIPWDDLTDYQKNVYSLFRPQDDFELLLSHILNSNEPDYT